MKLKYILFLFLLMSFLSQAQRRMYDEDRNKNDYRDKPLDSAEKKLFVELFGDRKTQKFKKEKVYAQTNHVFYKPGEVIYFKANVVDAQTNQPTDWSRILYAELYDPAGNRLSKNIYQMVDGASAGDFALSENAKGGIYKVRFYSNWMQNETHKNYFEKEITVQKTSSPRILMKLDFPKKGISAGEEVLADFSLRNLQNLPIPFYEGNYEVLIEGKVLINSHFKTDKEGKVQLKFNLPKTMTSSDALLNIKLSYNAFQESISRSIPVTLNYVEVLFFPESGSLVNGKVNNIAFKALNEFQQPVDIKAEIVNEKGKKISETESVKFGMGKFSFLPVFNQKFFLKLTSHQITKLYEIPNGTENGVTLNIEKRDGKIVLKIQSKNQQNVNVEAGFRGETVETKNDVSTNSEIEFNENIFPSGIARFTVFDSNKNPVAERVVFVNKNQNVQISIKPNKSEYLPREKVVFNIETKDFNGKPIPSNLAMSVFDDKLFSYADDRQNHIISWLQMDSELKGKIEEPPFYFKKEEEKADEALDLVMLTNGYRYFDLLPEVTENQTFTHQREELNSIYGRVENEKGEAVDAEVFMISDQPEVLEQKTKKGRFYFKNFPSDTNYQLIAKSKKPRENVKIVLLASQISSDLITQTIKSEKSGKEFEAIVKNPVAEDFKVVNKKEENAPQNSTDIKRFENKRRSKSDTISKSQNIEEVVVLTGGIEMSKKSMAYAVQSVSKENIGYNNIASVLSGKVAGLEITQNSGIPGNAESVVIRGISSITTGKQPLVIIDGAFVDFASLNMNSNNIKSVTVLKDAAATSIYGSRASTGVIIINSNSATSWNKKIDLNKKTFYAYESLPNYHLKQTNSSRVFTYPVYETPVTNYRTDFRETIYWNPTIQTDKNGKAQVEFYNSDANTTFRAIAEGISKNGLVGREEKTYNAQSKLQIDAKIPPYLTQGDEPKIAVILRNNSDERKSISFNKIIPKSMKLGVSDSLITLNPKESGRIILPLQGNKVVKSNIQLIAETDTEKERQILPFSIDAKGFRHKRELATSEDSTFVFILPDYFDESLISSFQVFKNNASQMLNDIDRLKEKSHGCFEQTSSTTYPNYFIYKYLQSQGNIENKEARRAISLLKNGYERLLTFETKEKGFSLFGDVPPNITLTAFGLMEFNDLKNVINVNPALIERTAKFILSKKDGKGNFILNGTNKTGDLSRKDHYYWTQQAYILYALSEVGMKSEILKEYEHLYQIHQYSEDFYLLSLLSNVAFQLNKTKDYEFLINTLTQKRNKNAVQAETNFMQGRGSDIKREALALFALGLMKKDSFDKNLVTKIIKDIETQNAYQSTQTLVIRLKALTEFYKWSSRSVRSEEPKIFLNNIELKETTNATEILKKGDNVLKVNYPSESGFPVLFSYQFNNLIPEKNANPELYFSTTLDKSDAKIGDNVRMYIKIENPTQKNFGMITSKIGIPAGLTMDPKNLKAMVDRKEIAYFEIFDNYLVLYWYHLDAKKKIEIHLDTKAEFAGKYTGKANHAFEYYFQQNFQWTDGMIVEISE